MSQQQIADIIGVPRGRYQQWENRKASPKYDDAKKIENFLSKSDLEFYNTMRNFSEPETSYEARKPPGEDIQALLDKIKLLEQSLRDKDDIIRLMKEKEKRAEALEKLFLSALSSRKSMKELHDLIENAVASKS